jgi:uracil-DNA glycosylase
MSVIITFKDSHWSWKTDSLYDFLYIAGHIPIKYLKFFNSAEIQKIIQKISDELILQAKQAPIYPLMEDTFRALVGSQKPIVVILGQDPYHNDNGTDEWVPGSAVGLAFSLPPKTEYINPSLKSIQTELINCGFKVDKNSGDLSAWVDQGVLLLNSTLTVRQGSPGKHAKYWYSFTEKLIEHLSETYNLVWILWGSHAQAFEPNILNREHQFLIQTSHPCPLSANKTCGSFPAFNGSKCFIKANEWLEKHGNKKIDWSM